MTPCETLIKPLRSRAVEQKTLSSPLRMREHLEDHDREHAAAVMAAILKAAPRIHAAETLAQRLGEAGLPAYVHGIPHERGCTVLVYVRGALTHVQDWLNHYAVPFEALPTSRHSHIRLFAATVSGLELSLVVTDLANPPEAA